MGGFAIGEIAGVLKSGADVFGCEVVLALEILGGHAGSQAADHYCNGQASATDDWFTVANVGVDDDAVVALHRESLAEGRRVARRRMNDE